MGDPWPRLPHAVRRYRVGFTLLLLFASSMPLLIPLILLALDRQEALGMFGILVWNAALVAMVAAYITTNRSLSKAGLTRAERSIVMHSASWTLAKRRNTNIATLLSNRPASSVPALSDDAATKVKATTAVLR